MFDNLELFSWLLMVLAVIFVLLVVMILNKMKSSSNSYSSQMKEVRKNEKDLRYRIKKDIRKSTLIGHNGRMAVYTPDNAKHIFICGTTGSGKTVALSNYIKQAFNEDYPALIIDGKGDIDKDSILSIVKQFSREKTYIINLTDPSQSNKYNPFKNANPTVCKDMLINLTNWSEEHYKLNTERYLQKVITLMNMRKIPLSFNTIIKHIPAEQFINLSMELIKDNVISKEEHLSNIELSNISGGIAESAAARFSLLLESELGMIFHEDGIDISSALKENAVIVFILNPLLYPETSVLMGRLVLIDSKKAVSHLFNNERRSFFIFDEINSYASAVLLDLVNKSRSANVTCILSTQSLSDLDYAVDENFKEQVIENCNNYILLRQNSAKNAENWANIIGTRKTVDTTYQLGDKTGRTAPTGMGTLKFTKEYIFHPDDIKNLNLGEGFYISKDNGQKIKIKIHKPF